MLSTLFFGLVVGTSHAFEADHVAAVSTLVAGKSDRKTILRQGLVWGLGHALVLLLVGGTFTLLGRAISPSLVLGFEAVVGLMLTGLGLHVLYRLKRERVHFHRHTHQGGDEHMHLHSHREDPKKHNRNRHSHSHSDTMPWRVLLVGMMHGLAGSAALLIATATALASPMQGLAYIAVFGIGSMAGMVLVSFVLSIPLYFGTGFLSRINTGFQFCAGSLTAALGIFVFVNSTLGLFWM